MLRAGMPAHVNWSAMTAFIPSVAPLTALAKECRTVPCSAMAIMKSAFPKRRRSASADAALIAEIKRVEQMSILERMETALTMGRSLATLHGETKPTK